MPEYSLSQIEAMLRDLPRREFRERLRRDLERRTAMTTTTTERIAPARQTATPMLRVRNAAAALDFYKQAFGAREVMRFEAGGRIAHAEIEIGNSLVYLGEEAADIGYPSPDALGGSPVGMHLNVDDADAAFDRAVAAGARVFRPVVDQFYGDRSGQVVDPFGFTWTLAMRKEELSVEEMYRRMDAMQGGPPPAPEQPAFKREGFRTVTPYVVVPDAAALVAFTKDVFDAEETFRGETPGGLHAEVRIGDSMLMIGGGVSADRPFGGPQRTTAFHVYVKDTDAAYERALKAGAASLGAPAEMPYGERGAGVKDASGNVWYIATAHGDHYVPAHVHTLNVYLHPLRAEPLLAFMTRAFGATGIEKHASPDGVIRHAHARIGDSVIEMGEAGGPYQPMPTRFYLYVPDVDAQYRRALTAGATSIREPADQSYGDRLAGVNDAFGNQWYFATRIAK
jgi:PhnB protein